jgi:outer membrane protein TolC
MAIRLEHAERRALIARDSLTPNAGRIRAGAVRLYEQGRTGILPVFDALRSEREVRRDLIGALVAFQNARADMLALYGRWE